MIKEGSLDISLGESNVCVLVISGIIRDPGFDRHLGERASSSGVRYATFVWDDEEFDLSIFAEQIFHSCTRQGIRRIIPVGYSHGGFVALDLI